MSIIPGGEIRPDDFRIDDIRAGGYLSLIALPGAIPGEDHIVKKHLIGFTVSRITSGAVGGILKRSITVHRFQPIDSAQRMTEALGRSNFDYCASIAKQVKELTGGTIYFDRGLSESAVDFNWQANAETPEKYYALHIECPFGYETAEFLQQLLKITGAREVSYLDLTPRALLEKLIASGAVPVKYWQDSYGKYIPDDNFSLDSVFPAEKPA